MKKIVVPFLLSIIVISIGYDLIASRYITTTTFNDTNTIYVLEQGTYSSLEIANDATKNISNYVYVKENDLYHVYVGMSKNKENITKLEVMYKQMGNNIYVKEINIDNNTFIEKLKYYDNLLKVATANITLLSINEEILEEFEKVVLNNNGSI